jgi:orsellinic acid C2-O-methyltransferase
VSDVQRLRELLRGHVLTQLVASAVRFGIPDHLAAGDLDAAALGERTGIGLPELRRFLRALEALGIVEQVGERYRGTSLATLLRSDGLWHGTALMSGGEYYDAWANLDHALRTGGPAFRRDFWEVLGDRPDVARSFARTMRANTEPVAGELLEIGVVPAAGCIADLGAGDGTLLAALLRREPGLRGIALEQPALADSVRRTIAEFELADRCEIVVGDLRTHVPRGAALYMLKSVIHNWNDDDAVRILRNCKSALGANARLLIIERALESAILDLTMLVLFGARDRTPSEYAALATDAGLAVTRTLTTRSGLMVLEAMS